MSDRRWYGSSYRGSADQRAGSTGHQMSTNLYQQQQPRTQLTSLAADPTPPHDDCTRFSDPTQDRSSSAAHNRSITDTDKLQQRDHEHGYRGNSYRGDRRVPSRYSVEEAVDTVFPNPGHYPVDRSSAGFQPYFPGDTSVSTSAAPSYSRRLPWSEVPRSHYHSQVHFTRDVLG